jgi:hypothetical protein
MDRYRLGVQTANDGGDEETVITVGVLDMLMRKRAVSGHLTGGAGATHRFRMR